MHMAARQRDIYIMEYLKDVKASVMAMALTFCPDPGGAGEFRCPDWWYSIESAFRKRFIDLEYQRLTIHAQELKQFLPYHTRHVDPSHGYKGDRLFRIFDLWEPVFSCADELRTPPSLFDGPKWTCGISSHIQPCRVVSLGSNFEDSFEEGVQDAMNGSCSILIVDPTISRDPNRLLPFEVKVKKYGALLNSTVGVGAVGGKPFLQSSKLGPFKFPLVTFPTLLADHFPREWGRAVGHAQLNGGGSEPLNSGSQQGGFGPFRLSILKVDIEGFELDMLPDVWFLCRSGALTIDQLLVEIHYPGNAHLDLARKIRQVHSLFVGAPSCGLMLHHKEVNTWGCQGIYCAEFSFVSNRHAFRSMVNLIQRTKS